MQIHWPREALTAAVATLHTQMAEKRAAHTHFRLASHTAHVWLSLLLLLFLHGGSILQTSPPFCYAVGYSYSRFAGPVAGPEQKVFVRDALSGGTRVDYVAKPEYEFAYGVEDASAQISHNRREMRDGDSVQGVYSVLDPDGTLRVVKYTANNVNGFQAEVITNGVPIIHGHYDLDEDIVDQQQQQQYPLPTAPEQQEQHVRHETNNGAYDPSGAGAAAAGPGAAGAAGTGDVDYDDSRGGYEVHEQQGDSSEQEHDGEESREAADDSSSSEEAYEDASKEAHSYEESASAEDY